MVRPPLTRSPVVLVAVLALSAGLFISGAAKRAQADDSPPVVLIVMENHSYGATDTKVNGNTTKYVVGNTLDAPYINETLIPSGTLFTNYYANRHPSLPDYLELAAGTNAGCEVDSCPRDSMPNENLFRLLGASGTSFLSIAESMPANCWLANSGLYLVRHNPQTYFTNVDATSGVPYSCDITNIGIAPAATPGVPLTWPSPLPAFSFIAPNSCNGMHGTTATGVCPKSTDQIILDGDTWLSANVPALLNEGAIVILTWDEGFSGDGAGGGGHVPTIMVGPNVTAGGTDATTYNHSGLLAGLQNYYGLTPLLGHAAIAMPLPIPRQTPYAIPSITGLTPETGATGDPVTIAGTGLTNAYSVKFAGATASFSVDSDSSITATVPAHAQTGTVTVSTIGGTATSPDPFTFTPPLPSPGPTLIQHTVGSGTASTQASVAWTQTTVAGNLQVAAIGWSGSATVTPPSGWALAVSAGGTAIYYRGNAPAVSGASTFSLSVKGNWVLSVSEWNGIATSGAFDKKANATGKGVAATTAMSGTTPTTSQPVELSIAAIKALTSTVQSAPTNGFTQLDQRAAGTNDFFGAYQTATSAAGPQSTAVTLTPKAKWRGIIATFRAA